ncbi:hypothetical protein BOX15_Mlig011462g1 [Macrostomum lignano]|uniref:Glutamate [NMDA] receptor subunit 1 n=1 Tax=Macrostomum lignano TaxID=282301 RepID=A0A267H6S6_9PLAT|nr:hypothetical protein BOX15_Mlig011462g1 [Macrostomum lignano]
MPSCLLKVVFLELLIVIHHHLYYSQALKPSGKLVKVNFTVAALLSNEETLANFRNELRSQSGRRVSVGEDTVVEMTLSPLAEQVSATPLETAYQICDSVLSKTSRLFGVIVSHQHDRSEIGPLTASFTCSFYHIPLIGVTARDSSFSDKYSHSSFLRTVPPYSQQADGWAQLIAAFDWTQVVLIHSSDVEGRILLSRLETLSEQASSRFTISKAVELYDDDRNFTRVLEPVAKEQVRAILLYARKSEAVDVLLAARSLGMFAPDWGWLVSEQTLEGAMDLDSAAAGSSVLPQGVVGLRLSRGSERLHLIDAVRVMRTGIERLIEKRCRPDPSSDDCEELLKVNSPRSCSEKSGGSIFGRRRRRRRRSVRSIDDRRHRERRNIGSFRFNTRRYRRSYSWKDVGSALYESLVAVEFNDGATGRVAFDANGDRRHAVYQIVNADATGRLIQVGTYGVPITIDPAGPSAARPLPGVSIAAGRDAIGVGGYVSLLNVSMELVRWPGNMTYRRHMKDTCTPGGHGRCWRGVGRGGGGSREVAGAPFSFKRKTTLRVVTKLSKPFVLNRTKEANMSCMYNPNPVNFSGEVDCTWQDPNSGKVYEYCCFGYCIDLLRRLANSTPFNYNLYLVSDGTIGNKETVNGAVRWTGIVGDLSTGQADLAVAPMTITPERNLRVAFTKPFKYLGLTILVKRKPPTSSLGSFLQPFERTLWVLVGLSVHVVALVLYLLDRFSPLGRFKLARNQQGTDEEALNLSSAMWFAWGVLLNSGIGEGTPRSFSARVLGMVWAGFAMIIVASYTANLAAFLVLDRPGGHISGIDDVRLRNPGNNFTFATVKNSPVEEYFKRQLEYATMTRTMDQDKKKYYDVQSAIDSVRNEKLDAFIWDSARLNYEAAADEKCELMTAGDVFGRTGYGLAMPQDSPWIAEISQLVLNFHESGFMEKLDTRWILVNETNCKKANSSPATLGLTNMAGVFIMVAAGIVAGVFLIFIEIAYKRRRGLREKELELAKTAADRWRSNIEKRKILRRTLENEQHEEAATAGAIRRLTPSASAGGVGSGSGAGGGNSFGYGMGGGGGASFEPGAVEGAAAASAYNFRSPMVMANANNSSLDSKAIV